MSLFFLSFFFSGKLGGRLGGWGHERNCKTPQNPRQKPTRAEVNKCLRESMLQGRREFLALCQDLGMSWVAGSCRCAVEVVETGERVKPGAALVPHNAGTPKDAWGVLRPPSQGTLTTTTSVSHTHLFLECL